MNFKSTGTGCSGNELGKFPLKDTSNINITIIIRINYLKIIYLCVNSVQYIKIQKCVIMLAMINKVEDLIQDNR